MTLKYIGDGKHITGIPAQDLTDEDISRLAAVFNYSEADFIALLIQRGLYSQSKTKPAKKIEKVEDDGRRPESIPNHPDK